MRKIYWFLWVCCLGAALVACSNDDDEPGVVLPGGDGGIIGEIPGGDNIWPEGVRRVKRIGELSKLGLPQDLMHIEYDNQFVKGYWAGSGGVVELDFLPRNVWLRGRTEQEPAGQDYLRFRKWRQSRVEHFI